MKMNMNKVKTVMYVIIAILSVAVAYKKSAAKAEQNEIDFSAIPTPTSNSSLGKTPPVNDGGDGPASGSNIVLILAIVGGVVTMVFGYSQYMRSLRNRA